MLNLIQDKSGFIAQALDLVSITLIESNASTVVVSDGANHEYFSGPAASLITFQVGGALGTHTVRALSVDEKVLEELTFQVDARTSIEDVSGQFTDLFQMLHRSMLCYGPTGSGSIHWKGKTYEYFVPWILDHVHTAKGMQYFSAAARGLIDLLASVQREDGMIWSQAVNDPLPGYFDTRDEGRNYYTRRDGELRLMRQPPENHCEYNFVDCFYLCWKSSGDDVWMKSLLSNACRALDYTRNSPVRWSEKFGLLKRAYTIDSWDFQIDDEYLVRFPVGTGIRIDEEKTKFGIFFGDNTGYAQACEQLAEMLKYIGDKDAAEKYRKRGSEIRERLTALAWNGKFYQHRVEEDPSVKRDLGVDEKTQIAMSNAYSLNRDISHGQCLAILATYQDLLKNAPSGSPGEWYAIYPPFERGLGGHGEKWQYMNGGVHGHAAGELARGAFAHGRESYGLDILLRLQELAKRTNGRVNFAYTGAYEPEPPPQVFKPLDLNSVANMNLHDKASPGVPSWMNDSLAGNDMGNLPVGLQTLAGVPYQISDPAKNKGAAVVAVSSKAGLAKVVTVPVGQKGAALYLLHTCSTGSAEIGASVTFVYDDGTEHSEYLIQNRHFTGWWFPVLDKENAGVAWAGSNGVSSRVGISWVCLKNPQPARTIRDLVFRASLDGATYAVAGITLADRMPYHRPDPVSTGGPDNWAGGLCMAALIEGLAGVESETPAYQQVRLSPRWSFTSTNEVNVTARYAASRGYVSYRYAHDPAKKTVNLTVTGSGKSAELRLLLPKDWKTVSKVLLDGKEQKISIEQIEESKYLRVPLESLGKPRVLQIFY